MEKNHHVITGILIIVAGVILLAFLHHRVSGNHPMLHELLPLIFVLGLLALAGLWSFMGVKSPLISTICTVLALLAVMAFFLNVDLIRAILGLACIGFGLLMIYHLIAEMILARQR